MMPRAGSLTDHTNGNVRLVLELVMEAVKVNVAQLPASLWDASVAPSFVTVALAGLIVMTLAVALDLRRNSEPIGKRVNFVFDPFAFPISRHFNFVTGLQRHPHLNRSAKIPSQSKRSVC